MLRPMNPPGLTLISGRRAVRVTLTLAALVACTLVIVYAVLRRPSQHPRPRFTNGAWVGDSLGSIRAKLPNGVLDDEHQVYAATAATPCIEDLSLHYAGRPRRVTSIWATTQHGPCDITVLLAELEGDLGPPTARGRLYNTPWIRAARWDSEEWWVILMWKAPLPGDPPDRVSGASVEVYSDTNGPYRHSASYMIEPE